MIPILHLETLSEVQLCLSVPCIYVHAKRLEVEETGSNHTTRVAQGLSLIIQSYKNSANCTPF